MQNQIHPIDVILFKKDQKKYSNLISQFHDMCKKEFSEEELEPKEDWINSLIEDAEMNDSSDDDTQSSSSVLPEFYPVYVMMTKKKNATASSNEENSEEEEEVVGGIVLECYPRQKIFLMAYVVVSSTCRGQGVGRILVEYCKEWSGKSFNGGDSVFGSFVATGTEENINVEKTQNWKPILVIEVFQTSNLVQDQDPKLFEATANRQNVWKKLGFQALKNVDLIHPAKLRGGKYNIAVQSCGSGGSCVIDNKVIMAASQLTSWLKLFFRVIIEDGQEEDDDDEEEGEEEDAEILAEKHLKEVGLDSLQDPLVCGNEFWC